MSPWDFHPKPKMVSDPKVHFRNPMLVLLQHTSPVYCIVQWIQSWFCCSITEETLNISVTPNGGDSHGLPETFRNAAAAPALARNLREALSLVEKSTSDGVKYRQKRSACCPLQVETMQCS